MLIPPVNGLNDFRIVFAVAALLFKVPRSPAVVLMPLTLRTVRLRDGHVLHAEFSLHTRSIAGAAGSGGGTCHFK